MSAAPPPPRARTAAQAAGGCTRYGLQHTTRQRKCTRCGSTETQGFASRRPCGPRQTQTDVAGQELAQRCAHGTGGAHVPAADPRARPACSVLLLCSVQFKHYFRILGAHRVVFFLSGTRLNRTLSLTRQHAHTARLLGMSHFPPHAQGQHFSPHTQGQHFSPHAPGPPAPMYGAHTGAGAYAQPKHSVGAPGGAHHHSGTCATGEMKHGGQNEPGSPKTSKRARRESTEMTPEFHGKLDEIVGRIESLERTTYGAMTGPYKGQLTSIVDLGQVQKLLAEAAYDMNLLCGDDQHKGKLPEVPESIKELARLHQLRMDKMQS